MSPVRGFQHSQIQVTTSGLAEYTDSELTDNDCRQSRSIKIDAPGSRFLCVPSLRPSRLRETGSPLIASR